MQKITLSKPDDWHLHLRDGAMLESVAPISAQNFARALIMPNLNPPIVNAKQAQKYRNAILHALSKNTNFKPCMTLYLRENTTCQDIIDAKKSEIIKALKLYPAGATTNSDSGVRDFSKIYKILEQMAKEKLTLCIHGEIADETSDIFDREKIFIEKVLIPIQKKIPELKIVLEHITTKEARDYVLANENIAATITCHHLVLNRNHMLSGGIRPHYYCLPVAKREQHRLALIEAATSGNEKFFFGSDSAPHTIDDKQSECGCAGCFTAICAMPILAQIFDNENKLDKLENFTSHFGAKFYDLPINSEKITLTKQKVPIKFPKYICLANEKNGDKKNSEKVLVFDPQFAIYWQQEKDK